MQLQMGGRRSSHRSKATKRFAVDGDIDMVEQSVWALSEQ